jgi:lipopolysaccharide/colanic/teichoic acid biosynthesis glycosyltransferase
MVTRCNKCAKLSKRNLFIKMVFDILFAFFCLALTWWIILIAWIVSSFETRSNGFFFQKRVGIKGRIFCIVKIKTMKDCHNINNHITSPGNTRITKIGNFFRKTKIDELPQLWNILVGQMSFVGPRPDVSGYADRLQGSDKIILSIKPGVTGPAQLIYKNEGRVLASQNDPIKYNDKIIWPDKVRINRRYIENYSFFQDCYYIWKTIVGGNVKY